MPVPLGSTTVAIAGAYTSPSKRDLLAPVMGRTEIYRGFGIEAVSSFDVDPEGRFLIAVSGVNGSLYQIHINEERAPEIIANSTAHPVLDEDASVSIIYHETQGLGWRVLGDDHATYFWDGDNDGVFDSFQNMCVDDSDSLYPFGTYEVL